MAIVLFDREMRYLAASSHWKAGHGLDGASLAGLSHYDVFPQTPRRWREVISAFLLERRLPVTKIPWPVPMGEPTGYGGL